jgi:hypothetical protein
METSSIGAQIKKFDPFLIVFLCDAICDAFRPDPVILMSDSRLNTGGDDEDGNNPCNGVLDTEY